MRTPLIPLLALFAACSNCHREPAPTAPTAPASAAPSGAPFGAPAPTADASFTLPALTEDPRFAPAIARSTADPVAAAALLPAEGLSPTERALSAYLRGQWLLRGGDPRGAAEAFQGAQSADPTSPLGRWPTLRAAQALLAVKDYAAAAPLARAARAPGELDRSPEALVAAIDATLGAGDGGAVRPLLDEYLRTQPKGPRVGAVLLARARLGGEDACGSLRKAWIEHPAETRREEAEGIARGIANCSLSLNKSERLQRLEALSESDSKAAAREAEATLRSGEVADGPSTCRIAGILARGEGKKGASVGDAWSHAADVCTGAERAKALWNAGKAYGGKAPDAAAAAYAKVDSEHADNSLADDARLKRGLLLLDQGKTAEGEALLASVAEAYPSGDMAEDALFRAALSHLLRGDDDGARPLLAAIVAREDKAKNRAWASRGRARYFLARCDERKGDREAALRGYESVIAQDPLAYYMLLAHSRLASLDADRARGALSKASDAAAKVIVPAAPPGLAEGPAVRRALQLLRVGEVGPARSALADDKLAEDPAIWALLAPSFAAAGGADVAHNPFRGKFLARLDDYPSGAVRRYWEAAFPRPFLAIVREEAARRGVSAALVYGVMREESTFVRDIKSPTGAVGLLQLMPDTAKVVARGTEYSPDPKALAEPTTNIPLGTKLLGELQGRYEQRFPFAVGGYNAGPGAVDRWLRAQGQQPFDLFVEAIPYDETRGYTKRVLASMAAYAWLYEPEALPSLLQIPLDLPAKGAARLSAP